MSMPSKPVPPPVRISFEVKGLRELSRVLHSDELIADAWKQAVTEVAKHVYDRAIVAAPIRSGRTVARMSYKVQNKPIPMYAVVKTTARRGKVSYPRVLNVRPKFHHAGWFRNAAKSAQSAFDGILQKAGSAIEKKWPR